MSYPQGGGIDWERLSIGVRDGLRIVGALTLLKLLPLPLVGLGLSYVGADVLFPAGTQ